jgi:hypothetical protein
MAVSTLFIRLADIVRSSWHLNFKSEQVHSEEAIGSSSFGAINVGEIYPEAKHPQVPPTPASASDAELLFPSECMRNMVR